MQPDVPVPDFTESIATRFANWEPSLDVTVRAKDLLPGYRIKIGGTPRVVKSISNFMAGNGHKQAYTRIFFNDGTQAEVDQYKVMGYEVTTEHLTELSLVDLIGTRDLALINAIHTLKAENIGKYTELVNDYDSGIGERRAAATQYLQDLQREAATVLIINDKTLHMPEGVYARYELMRERCEDYGLPSTLAEMYFTAAKQRLLDLSATRMTDTLIAEDVTDASPVCLTEMNYLMALLANWSTTGTRPHRGWVELRLEFQDPLKEIKGQYPAAGMLKTIIFAYAQNKPDFWDPAYDLDAFLNSMRSNRHYKTIGPLVPNLTDEGFNFSDIWDNIVNRIQGGRTEIDALNLGELPKNFHIHAPDSLVDSGGRYDPSVPIQSFFQFAAVDSLVTLKQLLGKTSRQEVYELSYEDFVSQMTEDNGNSRLETETGFPDKHLLYSPFIIHDFTVGETRFSLASQDNFLEKLRTNSPFNVNKFNDDKLDQMMTVQMGTLTNIIVYELLHSGGIPIDEQVMARSLTHAARAELDDFDIIDGGLIMDSAQKLAAELGARAAVSRMGPSAGALARKAASDEARRAVTSVFDQARGRITEEVNPFLEKLAQQEAADQWPTLHSAFDDTWEDALEEEFENVFGNLVPEGEDVGGFLAAANPSQAVLDAAMGTGELYGGVEALGNPATGAWVSQQAMNVDMQWADERRTGADHGRAGAISIKLTPDEIAEMLKRRGGEQVDGEEAVDGSPGAMPIGDYIEIQKKSEQAVNEAAKEGMNFWDFWGPFSTDD